MEILIYLVGVIFFVISLNIKDRKMISILNLIGGVIVAYAISIKIDKEKPSAMDVYQGKTTLTITYRNGIPIDSVVVFKEK